MIAAFLIGLTLFGLPFITGTGAYVSARILLPDMGLTVPDWTAFYWSSFFLIIVLGAMYIWNEVIDAVFG